MKKFVKFLKNRTPLGWLQLSHDPARLLTAISGIAFADILIFMQLGFLNSLYDSSVLFHQTLDTDLVMTNPQALHLGELATFPDIRLYQAMDITGVTSTQRVYVNSLRWKNPQTNDKNSIMVIGLDLNSPATTISEVYENIDSLRLPDTFLFDRTSRGEYAHIVTDFEQGKIIRTEIEKRTITVKGLFKMGASFGADATLIGSDQNFLRLFPRRDAGSVSLGLINVSGDVDQVKNNLNHYFRLLQDVEVMTKEEFMAKEKTYWGQNRPAGVVFIFGMVMGFVVGLVIVYQILSTDVNDHLTEYATFKAMGFSNSYLLMIVFEEAIILAIAGFLPGMTIAVGLYAMARRATSLPIYMTLLRIMGVFLTTVVMCIVSGAIATRKLQSADPADIF
ncbi:ABC transporter permease DevC [Geminocystis sp.]|uniref:ABC transporter permease DevC n=1 Tax=Geminocystis sp. TaxID=2664100 RepID=UPI003593F492